MFFSWLQYTAQSTYILFLVGINEKCLCFFSTATDPISIRLPIPKVLDKTFRIPFSLCWFSTTGTERIHRKKNLTNSDQCTPVWRWIFNSIYSEHRISNTHTHIHISSIQFVHLHTWKFNAMFLSVLQFGYWITQYTYVHIYGIHDWIG